MWRIAEVVAMGKTLSLRARYIHAGEEQFETLTCVLKMHGYQGWFGIDINPERMPVERALINSMDALKAYNDRINRLDHEQVVFSTAHPDQARGHLEAVLLRARASDPGKLSPMPSLEVKW